MLESRKLSAGEKKKIARVDRKDRHLFNLAKASGARYIISKEQRLERIRLEGIDVISPGRVIELTGQLDSD